MLVTSVGELVVDLFTDLCPLATKNFLKLCKIKYYNNCLFHSVQKDFIVQTGDPTGTGKGGDSVYKLLYGDQARFFDDEFHPTLKHDKVGIVAMASAGENANASQFYITTRAELDYLDEKHTVFGEVGEGLDTLMRINEAFVDDNFRPFKNIRIKHTIILDDPFDDPAGLADLIPEKSPELKPPADGEEVRLEDDWVPMDETMDPEELEKSLRKKEAQSRAVVLEMIGDLPEADMKPPENVLFVCKLNPVTEEGDLELIFGRFGKVKSADIIRDYKTGDSLCYAFIEFETEEACEAAYFKMDNVLIDDRRIHVDFSQSVSHLWNRYRKLGKAGGDGQAANGGKGCFKCGEVGHFAKECPNNGTEQKEGPTEKPKYTIKDTGGQRGHAHKKYEMVFDDDEAPPEQRETEKHRYDRHKYARESDKERSKGDQDEQGGRPGHHAEKGGDRSRQGARYDKERDAHRDSGFGHHSRQEREFDKSEADRNPNRGSGRESGRSRNVSYRGSGGRSERDRESEKPREERDPDRRSERDYEKSRAERDTDRRNERDYEKPRADRDTRKETFRADIEKDTGRRGEREHERFRAERDADRKGRQSEKTRVERNRSGVVERDFETLRSDRDMERRADREFEKAGDLRDTNRRADREADRRGKHSRREYSPDPRDSEKIRKESKLRREDDMSSRKRRS